MRNKSNVLVMFEFKGNDIKGHYLWSEEGI